ncbi:putative cyclic nucleotide-gated ion channel 16 [Quercus suber]|uniref:Cyclic nucleotide-gated ion channel 16 n=1 Tax=Quercus suber TaxID=58331 RepID=A0AAW0MET7_QUESU
MHSIHPLPAASPLVRRFPKSFSLRREDPWWHQVLDPGSEIVTRWNFIFLVASLLTLFLDPLYFFLPVIGGPACMEIDYNLSIAVTVFRTIADLFHLLHMIMKFQTAFVAPSSRVFGRGELVMDRSAIAARYLKSNFIIDLAATLPLPQRQHQCWSIECSKERNATRSPSCNPTFLDCSSLNNPERRFWLSVTKVLTNCDAQNDDYFQFGLFADAFTNDVASSNIIEKYFYCLWWGLRNLSSYGQNLATSTFMGEILFSILICLAGLVLFSHLIGNMQNYLQSTTARLEEWRVKRRDTEEWMRNRQLPPELQERVRRFVQYKWISTRGVDEESILRSLPLDTRRDIQRHLCLALVRRVPFFEQMDNQLLDAICERLVSSLNTKETYIVREGDPVNEMLFIIRGQLESSTTNGGRSGFFNSITLRPGDFCGEELLTWALMPTSSLNLPSSTRTVKSLTEVEAFALRAEDLKFVASQFKRLHSKKLQHAFRYYSHQWRTWGACFLQVAWRRYMRRKKEMELARQEDNHHGHVWDQEFSYWDGSNADYKDDGAGRSSVDKAQQLGATILASKFAANTRRGIQQKADATTLQMPKLFKPEEPDFSTDQEDS